MISLKRDFELERIHILNFINLTEEEKEMVRNWRNNEAVKKWMHSKHAISREEHRDFIEKLKNDDRNYYWLLKDNLNRYVGVVYLNKVDSINKYAYLGIYKNPDSALAGAGRILMKCLKEITFDMADLKTLKLEVMNDNTGAIRFFKKSGFKEESKKDHFSVMSAGKEEKTVL